MTVLKFADWLAEAPSWIQALSGVWTQTAPGWLVRLAEWFQDLLFQLYKTLIYGDRWKFYTDGLKITFIVTIAALALGVVIGLIIAVIRTVNDSYTATKPPILLRIPDRIAKIYLAIIRGTPMMVQLLIMGFVIMVPKEENERVVCAIVTLGINSGAYVAEIIRSGLMSVDKGQTEAGRSLGFNYIQTMWHIVIPQAIKNILPALGNEMITLLKDTSLVKVIALEDVTMKAELIISKTYSPLVPYIILAIIYLVIVLVMTKLLNIFEKRLRKSDH